MSDTIATYTFLPWLRQGIANKIDPGNATTARAVIPVKLKVTGNALEGADLEQEIVRNVALYGPGDIIGVDKKAIVRNEPRDWITNFEANYMPYVEFYDEDFPWRYSPSVPQAHDRLTPWMTLVVLKEDEFKEGTNMIYRPLNFIEATDPEATFPPKDQLWAWAHVHANESLIDGEDNIVAEGAEIDGVIADLKSLLNKNPDLAYSRIVGPRKLEPNTPYHAFLVPSFESGRLAGLGLDPSATPGVEQIAWETYTGKEQAALHPYYHRWYFRTGTVGDFEYLVRLLEPRPVDSRVGRRPIDVQKPGVNVSGITDPDLEGILKLGGALKIPFDTLKQEDKDDVLKYDNWDQNPYPHQFQKDLAGFINLADDYDAKTAEQANADSGLGLDPQNNPEDRDPLITAPLYGRWHALVQRLLKERDGGDISPNDNWVHELNLDPRYRVAAGFGTHVVQENQENYMMAAWKQVGDILEANRKIRLAQLAKETSWVWYDKHLRPMVTANPEKAFFLTRPVQKRVIAEGVTVHSTVKRSRVPLVITSTAMRRVMRPGSRLMKALPFNGIVKPFNLVERINNGEVFPAPPKTVPADLPTIDDVAEDAKPSNLPPWLGDWIKKYPWSKWVFLVLALIILLLLFLFSASGAILAILGTAVAVFAYLFYQFDRWEKQLGNAESVKEDNMKPEAVDELPTSPDFKITPINSGFTPTFGGTDSLEAVNFKSALKDSFHLLDKSRTVGKVVPKPALDLAMLVNTTFTVINPELTIPKMIFNAVLIPARIRLQLVEKFVEAMAYPEFDIPMYEPLKNISAELFLPNINFISQNSISLLETNQKFIEAYMVGLNHEFARELLWREYPTDQRGSYFRQFWDVSDFMPEETGLTEEELKERMRDIPPLHRWSKFSELGDHDHREEGGDKEEELVLVIRGELLKKYPNAIIYAHKAEWQLDDDGNIDSRVERVLTELSASEEENPPKDKVKTPLYEAKVDPDITFFGFDITAKEAQGGTGDNPDDEPGWFFVIKERPGEPRFGLDLEPADDQPIDVWNDLSWERVQPTGNFLEITNATETIEIADFNPTDEPEKEDQNPEDKNIIWSKDMNSAELAYILYQVPVMVAVHAAEMLPKQT
ncbi:hypothetical protein RQM65_03655 [Pricia sp. S334]|uniref:Uncharacterized protein n=1 Tax=Pricia mediterranea TaxID=3076079 RepID=A0ABU3L1Z9_9FLAO|nr:hypothetical protein [Pricia sp. S334]MDT7827759.1 hypothetical protein [Pricia sp. S334]